MNVTNVGEHREDACGRVFMETLYFTGAHFGGAWGRGQQREAGVLWPIGTTVQNVTLAARGGGATTTGPDATHPPTIFHNLGGAVGRGVHPGVGGGVPAGEGGVRAGGQGGVQPGVRGEG